jgi:hypothetical protein
MPAQVSNRTVVYSVLSDVFRPRFLAWLVSTLKQQFGEQGWWEQGVKRAFKDDDVAKLGKDFERRYAGRALGAGAKPQELGEILDVYHFRNIVECHWKAVFGKLLPEDAKHWLTEVARVRNIIAHPTAEDLDELEAGAALDDCRQLLAAIGEEKAAARVSKAWDSRALAGKVTPRPWHHVAMPHEDIREGRYDPNVFAANLALVERGKARADYQNPRIFFRKTSLTAGLRSLLADVFGRLTGVRQAESVIHMVTPFGGGKTHSLLAVWHLARDPEACLAGNYELAAAFKEAGIGLSQQMNAAALVGTDLNPLQGRRGEDGIERRTLWGEMAYQLGGPDLYAKVAENDQRRVPPGLSTLADVLREASPCVVLMDEVLEYLVKAAGAAGSPEEVRVGESSLAEQTMAFLHELTEAAGSVPKCVLLVSLPYSIPEQYGEAGERLSQRMTKVVGRTEARRAPVAGHEIYEIIRRRLFEDLGDPRQHQAVADAYAEHYRLHRQNLPEAAIEPEYRDRIVKSYPFHPELIDLLYERWGSLQDFQRTRGVLRLLALVVGKLYNSDHGAWLIQPSHVSLAPGPIRDELVKYVGQDYDAVLSDDAAGPNATAPRLDRQAGGDYHRYHLCEGLAASIFLETFTGREGGDPGATQAVLNLCAYEPDTGPADIAEALSKLERQLYYLGVREGRHRFSTQPNLNKILVERETSVDARKSIPDQVERALGSCMGGKPFSVELWPDSRGEDVDDRRMLTLVVLSLERPYDRRSSGDTVHWIRDTIKNHKGSFRTNKNALVFLAADANDVQRTLDGARRLLALMDMRQDMELLSRLGKEQKQDLDSKHKEAASALPEVVRSAYRHVFAAGEGEDPVHWDLQGHAYRAGSTICERLAEFLERQQKLLSAIDPSLISTTKRWKLWPDDEQYLNLDTLLGYFYQFTYLPKLVSPEVLKDAIALGVQAGQMAYYVGNTPEAPDPDAVKQPGAAVEGRLVELTEGAWVLRPAYARQFMPAAPPPKPPLPGGQPPTPPEPPIGAKPPPPPPGATGSKAVTVTARPKWQQWHDFFTGIIKPLADEGADVQIDVNLRASSEKGIEPNLVDLVLRENLTQYRIEGEVETEGPTDTD